MANAFKDVRVKIADVNADLKAAFRVSGLSVFTSKNTKWTSLTGNEIQKLQGSGL